MKNRFLYTAVALAGFGLAGFAQANDVLQFDLNSLTTQAVMGPQQTEGAAFSATFTGALMVSDDINSTLADMLINGTAQNISAGQLSNYTSEIDLVNGSVVGGSMSVTDTSGNIYTALIQNGSGTVIDLGVGSNEPGRFLINGLTFQGVFNSDLFAGVDVSRWSAQEPLSGSFLQFKFTPDLQGVDNDTDIDLFAVVPAPAPAAMGFLGLAGLGAVRRRRA